MSLAKQKECTTCKCTFDKEYFYEGDRKYKTCIECRNRARRYNKTQKERLKQSTDIEGHKRCTTCKVLKKEEEFIGLKGRSCKLCYACRYKAGLRQHNKILLSYGITPTTN